jgi:transcriptional regulator with GAF, ATPase, and Fis domain
MAQPEPVEPTFVALARQLRVGKTVDETYAAVAAAAVQLIDGCVHAGIGVLTADGHFDTAAATDDVVDRIDAMQREVGEGPCLEASAEERWQHDNDITTEPRWPKLAALVLPATPVRAMLAYPLVHEGRRGGALNLFGDRPNAFDARDTELAAMLAAFASVALVATEEQERANLLAAGLDTNREIGKAIGLLMATHSISADQAFDVLRRASQQMNRKLRDIAAELVLRHDDESGDAAPDPRQPV